MKVGIVGAGGIVSKVLPTLKQIEDLELYAIAAITLEEAEAFGAKNGCFQKAYGSCEELVSDPEVELVYVATPHSFHYQSVMMALEHGKPVLCEKAFTLNAEQAKKIRDKAREKDLFVAEAMWFRYMPSRKIIRDLLDTGIIGNIRTLTGNLSYKLDANPRLTDINQAGGALLDVGIYGVSFALLYFGTEVTKVDSSVYMTDGGVDGMESVTIHFKDGKMAVLTNGIYGRSDRHGVFYGEKGYIVLDNINNTRVAEVYDTQDVLLKRIEMPAQISGYEFEWRECIRAIKEGKKSAPSMPLEDTIAVLVICDKVRKQWGLKYPQE